MDNSARGLTKNQAGTRSNPDSSIRLAESSATEYGESILLAGRRALSDVIAKGDAQRPITIALCIVVPAADEAAGLRKRKAPRRKLAQLWDIASAFVRRRPDFHFYHWGIQASNKGDIAIRTILRAQLTRAFAPRPVDFIEVGWGRLEGSVDVINEKAQLLVFGGSGYICPRNGVLPKFFLDDAKALERIRCRKVAYSIGWNTLLGEEAPLQSESLAALKTVVRSLDLFAVRDRSTQASVKAVTDADPRLIADPVLFHREGHATPATRGLHRGGRPRVGINIAVHGPISAKNVVRDIGKIAELLRTVRKRFGADLHFISHSESDRFVWWLLLSRGIYLHWHAMDVDAMSDFYEGLDVHVGQMMHSTIFSVGANVPTLAIAYDRKGVAFFELLGLSEFTADVNDWDPASLIDVIGTMIARREEISGAIAARKRELAADQQSFLRDIRALLERTGA